MKNLIVFPLLALALIAQTAVVSRLPLLSGTADVTLVILAAWALQERVDTAWHWAVLAGIMTTLFSGLPFYVPIMGYLAVVGIAHLLLRRVWELPILAMFIVTFVGTLVYQVISLVALYVAGTSLPVADVFSLITLPSVLLNMLIALPIYAIMRDLADWVYPLKEGL
jgi:rod shape-determining protein MreD